jgi:hypothetical protein
VRVTIYFDVSVCVIVQDLTHFNFLLNYYRPELFVLKELLYLKLWAVILIPLYIIGLFCGVRPTCIVFGWLCLEL